MVAVVMTENELYALVTTAFAAGFVAAAVLASVLMRRRRGVR